jgi:nicotinamidase-related amidase
MKAETTIFCDVDTQRDFLLPGGKFHIAGAEKIIPKLKLLTELAREQKVQIVCSVDCHSRTDPMLKSNGGPYPDHCIAGTPGETKIDETIRAKSFFGVNNSIAWPTMLTSTRSCVCCCSRSKT